MAPTESDILTNFLIRPSSLDSIITYEWFTSHLPPSTRDHPSVRALWRDLLSQRSKTLDEVKANIETELKRGAVMRREVLRAKKEEVDRDNNDGDGDMDGEVELERMLFGEGSGVRKVDHSLRSIVPEVEGAVKVVREEIERLREEEEGLLEEVRQTVGGLSDLRYGRFANGGIRQEVIDGLVTLRDVCERKTR